MGIKKRVMAAILVFTMVMGTACTVFAATKSPADKPTTYKNPGYDAVNDLDVNTQDHNKTTVTSKVKTSKGTAVAMKAQSTSGGTYINIKVARTKDNKKVAVTSIGTSKEGAFNSTKGRKITWVDITSSANEFAISAKAFYNSNVKLLRIAGKKIKIGKQAFKGTKQTSMEIRICGQNQKRKASDFTFSPTAFTGLSKKAVFNVRTGAMTRAEFNKLARKVRASGFKGVIKHGSYKYPK